MGFEVRAVRERADGRQWGDTQAETKHRLRGHVASTMTHTHTHTQLGDPGIVKAQRYTKAWRLKLHAHFQKRVYGHKDNAAERKTRFSQMSEFLPELKWNDLNSYHKPLQWLESTELRINCPIFEKENSVLSKCYTPVSYISWGLSLWIQIITWINLPRKIFPSSAFQTLTEVRHAIKMETKRIVRGNIYSNLIQKNLKSVNRVTGWFFFFFKAAIKIVNN